MQLDQAADPLLFALGRVVDIGAGLERPGVDPEEGQLADERVGRDLEGQGAERLAVRRRANDVGAVAWIGADHRRHVERRGEVLDHRVEHRLDALVLEGGAAQDRDDLRRQRAGAEGAAQGIGVDLLPLQESMRDVVVEVGDRLHQLVAPGGGLLGKLAGDLTHLDQVTQVVPVGDRLHLEQVDHAAEAALGADRQLHRDGGGAEALADHVDHAPEVGASAIELVDEAEAGHAVAIGLAPDRLGLWLNARHAIEHDHGPVEHAEAPLDLHRKIHVAGRVNQVDTMIPPEAGRGCGRDGDAALLLLLHPVHRCGALVDLAELVDLLRVEEDPLRDGGLAGVDVRDDPNVAGLLEWVCLGHHRPTT